MAMTAPILTQPAAREMPRVDPRVEELLKGCTELPSLPAVAVQLLAECRKDDTDLARICELLARDPALAAKVVGVANSALYRRGDPATTVRRAALALGANAVTAIALSFSLVSQRPGAGDFDFAAYWRRALLGAVASRSFAKWARIDPEEAMLAGLLQDLGVLALHTAVPEYKAMLAESQGDHLRLERLERERLNTSHTDVGRWLAERLQLPKPLAHAVWSSHIPDLDDPATAMLDRCVAVSGYVAEIWERPALSVVTHTAAEAASAWLGMDVDTFQGVLGEVAAAATDFGKLFDVTLPDEKAMQEILRGARDTLVHVSLRVTQQASRSAADLKKLKDQKKSLEKRFSRDELTGVSTRATLDASLVRAFDNAFRFDRPLSLLFCDIDHFKRVNDMYGHASGDVVLAAVARAIGASIRQLDVVGRYGGEEFLVILPATDEEGALVVARRILARVAALGIADASGTRISLTISVGLATHGGRWRAPNIRSLLVAADKALYDAKGGGRNRVVVHSQPG
jgi:diguanylate cyclase (GGDEF)-like protein